MRSPPKGENKYMRIVFSVITGCLLALSACTKDSVAEVTEVVVDAPTVEAPLQEVVPTVPTAE